MIDPVTIGLDIPATHRYLNVVGACVREMIQRFDDLPDVEALSHDIQLAVHEICTNIVDHAYVDKDNGRIHLKFSYDPKATKLMIQLHDRGRKFNPTDVVKPRFDEPQERGFGLYLAHKIMDVVKYERISGENVWSLEKILS